MKIVNTLAIFMAPSASMAAAAPVQKQAGCDRVCHKTAPAIAHDPIVAMNRWFGSVGPEQATRYVERKAGSSTVAN